MTTPALRTPPPFSFCSMDQTPAEGEAWAQAGLQRDHRCLCLVGYSSIPHTCGDVPTYLFPTEPENIEYYWSLMQGDQEYLC